MTLSEESFLKCCETAESCTPSHNARAIVQSPSSTFRASIAVAAEGDFDTYNSSVCYYQFKAHKVLRFSSVFAHLGNIAVKQIQANCFS